MTKNKLISKLLTVAVAMVSMMAGTACNSDDTSEEVIDYSGIELDFSQVPLDTAKKAIIGKWERVREFSDGIVLNDVHYNNEYYIEYSDSWVITNLRGDVSKKKIKRWEKQDDGTLVILGDADEYLGYYTSLRNDSLLYESYYKNNNNDDNIRLIIQNVSIRVKR